MASTLKDQYRGGVFLPDATGVLAPAEAAYVLLGPADGVVNARILGVGTGELYAIDGGPGNVLTLGLETTAVVPGSYTAANITVDAFGRVTAASNGSASVWDGVVKISPDFTLSYAGDLLTAVTYADGRNKAFTYDLSGKLTQVVDRKSVV
jgi:YD repeat-containing protein